MTRSAVDIGDVSRSGCRFETADPLPVGSVGMLSVTISGEQHLEMFPACPNESDTDRRSPVQNRLEFLPLPAEHASLQDVVVQLESLDSLS